MAALIKGMRGPEVAALQQALAAQGYDIKVDGRFGEKTRQALKAFQKSAGLKADGAYGRQTAGTLQPPLPRPNPSQQFAPVQPQATGGGSGGASAMAQMQMLPQSAPAPSAPPGIGSDPDRNITSPRDPNFGAMIRAQLHAGQSNDDRRSLTVGAPAAFGTGVTLPQPPADGSSMATANSPMADGGPAPMQPRPQPSPEQFAAARAQLQQQMQPGPTPPTAEQQAAAKAELQRQLQPPQAGFQMPSLIGSAQAAERPQQQYQKRIIRFQGKTLAFPATATDEQIAQALSGRPPAQDGSLSVDNAVRATARGVPVVGSFLDEVNAATNATLAPVVEPFMSRGPNDISRDGASWGERYDRSLQMQRDKDRAFDEQHPIASTGLQVAGGVAGGLGALKAAPAAARTALGMGGTTLPGQIGSSALAGGALGTVSGFGDGEGSVEDRIRGAGAGMATGTAFGVAAPIVGRAVGKAVGAFTNKAPAAPTTEAIKNEAQAAYRAAKSSGLMVKPESFKARVDVLARQMADEGLDPSLHPKATAAMGRLMKANDAPLSLQDLDTLRQIAGDAAGSIEPGERRLGAMIREGIDDYIGNLKSADVLAGDAKKAAGEVVKARSLWAKMRKSELIDTALDKAERGAASSGSGGNIDNATRQKIRSLLDNPKTARQFSAAEKEALELVVRGGKAQNLLRLVGKLSPQGNGLMAALGIGATAANPAMAIIPAAGYAAKKGADALSARNMRMAEELIKRGAPAPKAGSPLAEAYARLITQITGQEMAPKMPAYQRSIP
jgi:lysozyme family protein